MVLKSCGITECQLFLFILVSVSIIELSFFLLQVPRSSKLLYEDNEYALYTVTLFGRVADNFRIAAREKGFQVGATFMMQVDFMM